MRGLNVRMKFCPRGIQYTLLSLSIICFVDLEHVSIKVFFVSQILSEEI